MFFPRSAPLRLAARGVRALRLAMNTPVVATEDLPAGPARAAILVHEDARGGFGLDVAVRSLRRPDCVVYSWTEAIESEGGIGTAVDAALSFAESMGFLFDDDELDAGEAGRARAVACWSEIVGEPVGDDPLADLVEGEPLAAAAPAAITAPPPLVSQAPILAQGVASPRAPGNGAASPSREGAAAPPAPPARPASAAPPTPDPPPAAGARKTPLPRPSLSKFRGRGPVPGRGPAAAAPPEAPPGSAPKPAPPAGPPLGRVQLVRRRVAGEAAEAPSLLLRLLGAF